MHCVLFHHSRLLFLLLLSILLFLRFLVVSSLFPSSFPSFLLFLSFYLLPIFLFSFYLVLIFFFFILIYFFLPFYLYLFSSVFCCFSPLSLLLAFLSTFSFFLSSISSLFLPSFPHSFPTSVFFCFSCCPNFSSLFHLFFSLRCFLHFLP